LIGSGIKESTFFKKWASLSGKCTPGIIRSYHGYDGFAIFARDMDSDFE